MCVCVGGGGGRSCQEVRHVYEGYMYVRVHEGVRKRVGCGMKTYYHVHISKEIRTSL